MPEQDFKLHVKVVAWLHVLEATLYIGGALLTRQSWSRILAMVLAILGLFLFPIGTIVGAYVLWVLTSEPAAAYFRDIEETTSTD